MDAITKALDVAGSRAFRKQRGAVDMLDLGADQRRQLNEALEALAAQMERVGGIKAPQSWAAATQLLAFRIIYGALDGLPADGDDVEVARRQLKDFQAGENAGQALDKARRGVQAEKLLHLG